MGNSADGILAYGFNLGGDEGGWEVAEADSEYGEWKPDWYDEDEEDLAGDAEKRLLEVAGFSETDYKAEGYYDRKREAEARVGVELVPYCSFDYPIYVLAAHAITVYQGHAKEIDWAELERQRVSEGWDDKLTAAREALGVTPKQEQPKWLMVSRWG